MKLKTILIFLLALISVQSYGQKVYGSQIDYRQIDTFKYEVRLLVFNDCSSSSFQLGNHGTFQIKNSWLSSAYVDTLIPNLIAVRDISNYHDSVTSCDSGGSLIGIHEYEYLDTIDFNTTYSSIKSSNLVIFEFLTNYLLVADNVCTFGTYRSSLNYAELRLQKQPTKASFSSTPSFFYTKNFPVFTTHNAAVNNGLDSVSYRLVSPLIAYNNNAGFNICGCGFSSTCPALPFHVYYPGSLNYPYQNPNSSPPIGIYFDPITSELIYTPITASGDDNYAVEATIWKENSSGTMEQAGKIRRELFHFHLTSTNNNPPIVNGPYAYNVCAGAQLCFNITTNDNRFIPPPPASPPPADTVSITWDSAFKHFGASFTITNPNARLQTGQFCWTPTTEMASDIPYVFTVTAKDNAGPINAVTSRSFRILVKQRAETSTSFTDVNCNGNINGVEVHSSIPSNFKGVPSYRHQILDSSGSILFNRKVRFKSTDVFLSLNQKDTLVGDTSGTFIIQTTINNSPLNCPINYFDTLQLNLFDPDVALFEDTILFCHADSGILSARAGMNSYLWSTGDTALNTTVHSNGDYWLRVTDSCGFEFEYNAHVTINNPTPLTINELYEICPNDSLPLEVDSTYQFVVWSNGDSSYRTAIGDSGYYSIAVEDSGCFLNDSFEVKIIPAPEAEMIIDSSVCDEVTLSVNYLNSYVTSHVWNIHSINLTDDTVTTSNSGYIYLTSYNSCESEIINELVSVVNQPVVNLPEDTAYVCDNQPIVLSPQGNNPNNWLWSTSQVTPQITVAIPRMFTVTNFAYCDTVMDSVLVVADVTPIALLGSDTSICEGDSLELKASPFPLSSKYRWSGNFGDSSIHIASAGSYVLEQFNVCGSSLDTMNLQLIDLPMALLPSDTSICEGDTITLFAMNTANTDSFWWNNTLGDTSQSFWQDGRVVLKQSNVCGSSSDSMAIQHLYKPAVFLGPDLQVKKPFSRILTADSGYAYTWNTGEKTQRITVRDTGWFWVDATNICGTTRDSLQITDTSSAGISRINALPIEVYPNPTAGSFTIKLPNSKPTTVQLLSAEGRLMEEFQIAGSETIDLTDFADGVYLLKLAQTDNQTMKRIIKRN